MSINEEMPLAGGFVTQVVRIGQTVRRKTGPWSPAVHTLLTHLEAVDYPGAPQFQGFDDQGREILTFIEGHVPSGANPDVVTELALEDVGRLMRRLHTVSAEFNLPPELSWHFESLSGPAPHVVCHHDLSPKNTVFRDGRAVAFIDWDMATPEAAIHDVIHAAWQFVPLVSDESCRRQGWAQPPDRGRRLRILLDAYGLEPGERAGLAVQVAERTTITASGIEHLAREGTPAFRRLVDDDVPAMIRQDGAWILAHAETLDSAILR
jgi:Phosphotransferase enzyme family